MAASDRNARAAERHPPVLHRAWSPSAATTRSASATSPKRWRSAKARSCTTSAARKRLLEQVHNDYMRRRLAEAHELLAGSRPGRPAAADRLPADARPARRPRRHGRLRARDRPLRRRGGDGRGASDARRVLRDLVDRDHRSAASRAATSTTVDPRADRAADVRDVQLVLDLVQARGRLAAPRRSPTQFCRTLIGGLGRRRAPPRLRGEALARAVDSGAWPRRAVATWSSEGCHAVVTGGASGIGAGAGARGSRAAGAARVVVADIDGEAAARGRGRGRRSGIGLGAVDVGREEEVAAARRRAPRPSAGQSTSSAPTPASPGPTAAPRSATPSGSGPGRST